MSDASVPRHKRDEKEEERRARKERERAERKAKEQKESEKNPSIEGEKRERKHKRDETEEERRARKERERAERKEREKEKAEKNPSIEGEKRERKHKRDETEEERRARKERERAERKEREKEKAKQEQEKQMQQEHHYHHHHNGDDSEKNNRRVSIRDDDVVDDELQMPPHQDSHENRNAAPAVETIQKEELAAAMDAENDAIRQSINEAKEAARRDERRRAEEDREREAMERREKRRKEREEKRGRRSITGDEGEAMVGKSSIGVADLQRQGYRNQFEKDLQRATALRRLVDMDDASAPLVDIPPLSQYDIYIRSFGDTGRKQAGVQAPPEEDRADAEAQAERVRVRHRSIDVPRDLGICPEQNVERPTQFTKDVIHGGVDTVMDENDNAGETSLSDPSGPQVADSALLSTFLGRIFPVMRAILDENDEEGSGMEAIKLKSETQFSTSYTTFCFNATRNRPVIKVLFNPCAPTYCAVLHGIKEEDGPSTELDRYMSVILIWNIYDPSLPEKVLVSLSLVTSICISPRKPYLIYAGTEDGSLCVWDTREPERNHSTAGRYQTNAFRLPSFASSWLPGNHKAPIVAVAVAGYNSVVGIRKDENEQLVSLDSSGETHFWVVNEKDQSKGMISDTENGLHMFSTIRLFLANSKNDDQTSIVSVKQESFALDFVPADPSHYVVACAEGVRHISRFGSVAAPSVYAPSSRFFGRQIAVPSCVRYSVLDSRILMAGYGDGCVRLFLHSDGAPQLSIPLGIHRIMDIRFGGADKWLSWVLDAGGTFYLLDLAKRDKEFPVFSQALSQPETGVCTCFDIPPEGKADTRVILLGFERGVAQLHALSDVVQPPASDRDEHWL